MTQYTPSLDELIDQFQEFPGIGKRSAERLAFYTLHTDSDSVHQLIDALRTVQEETFSCSRCHNVTEEDPCTICQDPRRDQQLLCVCETPRDVSALESCEEFNGVYHVLMGRIDPVSGVDMDDLTMDALRSRVRDEDLREVIIATNPTSEGDATAMHLQELLEEEGVEQISRLARGIPSGSSLEYMNPASITEAFLGRQSL